MPQDNGQFPGLYNLIEGGAGGHCVGGLHSSVSRKAPDDPVIEELELPTFTRRTNIVLLSASEADQLPCNP